ncbi:sensor histidine kinase [Emticicia sp. CRIBPO]|uniref:sensor histidine kinase n=1 Tax=Emticicia sp. CRIBPO TaxID=2683258 RepID=UPI001411D80D|nr:histidine kinase [Emticicia sp. CRIBPO]NBA86325.1 sensor histidine kinase [Emticicia sp. CRIBPO]
MNQKQAYWFSQIMGWTFYLLTFLINHIAMFSFNYDEFSDLIGNCVVNIIACISLTHFFRMIFKKYNWIKLPILQLIFRCFGVILLMAFVMTAINIPLDSEIINTEKMHWALIDISYIVTWSKPFTIWILLYVSYAYTNERKNDAIERIKLQTSVEASEAKILRAQMNPHFMFNALNSIRALIVENPQKAQTGITQLSNILRSSLVADRRTTVSLKEELKTIEDYLGLEKVRYEERLQVKWDIDENTLGVQVPPMMLQTLVENAIKHGVQKALRWGFVEINTSKSDDFLYIKIRNTGRLYTTESKSEAGGFGLINTIKRLKLLYGEKANFRIYEQDELTVCAEITIPLDVLVTT